MPDQAEVGDENYEAYILRLTWSRGDGRPECRVSLQGTNGGRPRSFATVAGLCRFLASRPGRVALLGDVGDEPGEGLDDAWSSPGLRE